MLSHNKTACQDGLFLQSLANGELIRAAMRELGTLDPHALFWIDIGRMAPIVPWRIADGDDHDSYERQLLHRAL